MLQVVYRPGMRVKVRELVYAVLYAGACGGLVYCCGSSLWRIGDVPGGSKVLFAVMVFFGAYGAYLCGQTSVEIVQSLCKPGEAEEEPGSEEEGDSSDALGAVAVEAAAAVVAATVQRETSTG